MTGRRRLRTTRRWARGGEQKFRDVYSSDLPIKSDFVSAWSRLDICRKTADWASSSQQASTNWVLWNDSNMTNYVSRVAKICTSKEILNISQGTGVMQRQGAKLTVTGGNLEIIGQFPDLTGPAKTGQFQIVMIQTKRNISTAGTIINSIPYTDVYENPITWKRKTILGNVNPTLSDVKVIRKKLYKSSHRNDTQELNIENSSFPERQISVNIKMPIPKRTYIFSTEGVTNETINYYWEVYAIYSTMKFEYFSPTNHVLKGPAWDTDTNLNIWSDAVTITTDSTANFFKWKSYNPKVSLRAKVKFSDKYN